MHGGIPGTEVGRNRTTEGGSKNTSLEDKLADFPVKFQQNSQLEETWVRKSHFSSLFFTISILQSGENRERLVDVRHGDKTAGDRRQEANLDISKGQIRVRV